MNVTIMSRGDAIRYCHRRHNEKTILISISDPYIIYTSKPQKIRDSGVLDILRLTFADADRVSGQDVYGRIVSEVDMMTDEDAQKIVQFINRYPNTDIIVHCDAGISRSSGVGAAILKYFTGDDSAIFKNHHYYPNMWCYRKTLTALMEQEDTDGVNKAV